MAFALLLSKIRIILTTTILGMVMTMSAVPVFAAPTGGIVPCGSNKSNTAQDACTICDLVKGAHVIVQRLMLWMISAGLLIITVAGITYIVSAGNPGLTSLAKSAVLNTLVGVVVILVAFLSITFILNNIFRNDESDVKLGLKANVWDFSCSTYKLAGGGSGGSGGGGTGGGAGGGTGGGGTGGGGGGAGGGSGDDTTTSGDRPLQNMTNAQAKNYINEQTGGAVTVWESSEGRTYMPDLRQSSIDGIINLQKESGTSFTITGAAEKTGHSGKSKYSHANGYKVDISDKNPKLNNYITSNYQEIGKRSDGARQFRDSRGNVYAWETWRNHWDVCFQCR